MTDSSIITEQFVRIEQTPASIGERILAVVIDYFVMAVYFVGAIGLLLNINLSGDALTFILICLVALPIFGYPLLCDIFNRGQTLGKKLLKLRTVKVDGSTPSIGAYMMRWILLIIDGPVFSYLGVIIIMCTNKNQRLGDLAAGTMVIKEQSYRKIQVSLDEFDYLSKGYRPIYPGAADLSLEQINVISRTLNMSPNQRDEHIGRLARKVQELLSVRLKDNSDEAFLQRVVRDYQYYALEEI